jgi:SAM-dependent methyltransferase
LEPRDQRKDGRLSAARPLAAAYEELAYPGYAYPAAHPARLEVVGRLFNLHPEPASGSRVLELGCGDGGNALAIAQTLPDAHVIGLDAAPAAIDRGRALARDAGLANVELRCGDLTDRSITEDLGEVDYVVAHGVYSWIPPAARRALLECARCVLAPHGIAFVSYNAYPGSYLRDMARDILAFHLRGVAGPEERLARAHELMETIVAAETPTPYAGVLREHLQRMLSSSDALLYHDELAPISTPFYFHEFIEHAMAHELQFLSEASLSDSQLRDVPERVAELMATLPNDVVEREQYLDFFTNRMFRQTLLVRQAAPVRREIHDERVAELALSSPARWDGERFTTPSGASMTTSESTVAAAMHELGDCWPESVQFADLLERVAQRVGVRALAPEVVRQLRAVLLEAYLGQLILLHGCPLPATSHAGERPAAGALARAQCRAGRGVLTTQLGTNWAIATDFQGRLLPLLDGRRDRGSLATELGVEVEAVEDALSELAGHGLLAR